MLLLELIHAHVNVLTPYVFVTQAAGDRVVLPQLAADYLLIKLLDGVVDMLDTLLDPSYRGIAFIYLLRELLLALRLAVVFVHVHDQSRYLQLTHQNLKIDRSLELLLFLLDHLYLLAPQAVSLAVQRTIFQQCPNFLIEHFQLHVERFVEKHMSVCVTALPLVVLVVVLADKGLVFLFPALFERGDVARVTKEKTLVLGFLALRRFCAKELVAALLQTPNQRVAVVEGVSAI